MSLPYHSEFLVNELRRRQLENPKLSLRGFAQYLNVHPSVLSLVMKGKRGFVERDIASVVVKLELDGDLEEKFRKSITPVVVMIDQIKINHKLKRYVLDNELNAQLISEWEYMAVLEMFDLSSFELTLSNMCSKINVTEERMQKVLEDLITGGFVTEDVDGRLKKVNEQVRTTEDVPAAAIRASHLQTLDMAKLKIEEIPVDQRDFSHMTLAIDPAKIPEAKLIIREFRQKMMALFEEGNKTSIYKFSIQAFPLSSTEKSPEVFP